MNEMVYDISVIVPIYNRKHELELTLDSLSKQTLNKNNYEVIVCDDGSKDSSFDLIKKYEKIINLRYCYQPDLGFRAASSRNMGIKLSYGKICVFLDNGVLLSSHSLENQIKYHNDETAVVIGLVYGFDDYNSNEEMITHIAKNHSVDDAIEILEKKNILDSREIVYKELGDDIDSYPAPWVLCWTNYLSVSKNMLFEIGLFDESYTTWGCEDNDIALALYKYKAKFVLGRDLKSLHFPHEKIHKFIEGVPELAQEELLEKQKYLLSKYPIDTIEEWFVTRAVELNQKLIKRRTK